MNKTAKYKQTEIGEIPESWDVLPVEEFAEVVGGDTPSTKDSANFNGDIPWITPRDLSTWIDRYISRGERSISQKGIQGSGAKLLPKNTVLLTSRAPVGYLAIAQNPVSTNQGFKSLIPKDNADSLFTYYLMLNNIERLKNNASGSTFQELSGGVLKQMKFGLPLLKEQQQIASILSSLDDKIELNRKMNKTLEQMGKAMFKRWFVDDAKETKEVELLEIVEFNPRESLSKGIEATYLEMKDLPEQGMWVYSQVLKPYKGGTKFRNGDTLMARITPCLENGKSGFVNFLEDDEVAFGSTEYIVLRPKDKTHEEFVYYLVRDEGFREFAVRSMVGSSGRQRVQTDAIKHYRVSLPSNDIDQLFHSILKPIFEQIKSSAIENEKLSAIRDQLLPRLMNGKLRVN